MSHVAHEIYEEFPEEAERIQTLRQADPQFAQLVDEYHAVNLKVHRAESRLDLLDEAAEHDLRHRRVHLKDAIAQRLHATA